MTNNNGKEGEKLFQQIMQSRNHQVQNVSANEEYYHKGDFILTDSTGTSCMVEVKWDEKIHKTNNLYLEIINTNSTWALGAGWWEYCTADYVAYGDAVQKQFYIFDLQQLRQRVKTLPEQYGYCGSNSVGLLVNLKSVQDLIIKTLKGERK